MTAVFTVDVLASISAGYIVRRAGKKTLKLCGGLEQLKVVNFDVFEVTSTECLFPGVVDYYFKFNT
eukprot:COSAG01_NODE_54049_length_334_cov_35.731915_1_plen_65_part_01